MYIKIKQLNKKTFWNVNDIISIKNILKQIEDDFYPDSEINFNNLNIGYSDTILKNKDLQNTIIINRSQLQKMNIDEIKEKIKFKRSNAINTNITPTPLLDNVKIEPDEPETVVEIKKNFSFKKEKIMALFSFLTIISYLLITIALVKVF